MVPLYFTSLESWTHRLPVSRTRLRVKEEENDLQQWLIDMTLGSVLTYPRGASAKQRMTTQCFCSPSGQACSCVTSVPTRQSPLCPLCIYSVTQMPGFLWVLPAQALLVSEVQGKFQSFLYTAKTPQRYPTPEQAYIFFSGGTGKQQASAGTSVPSLPRTTLVTSSTL